MLQPCNHSVYAITHLESGRVYVGKTYGSPTRRWDAHRYRGRQGFDGHLYHAIRKYGESAFDVQTLAQVSTNEEANQLERLWIIALRANQEDFGFNHTIGGDGAPHTAETKAKISAQQKNDPKRRIHLEKMWARGIDHAKQAKSLKKAWAEGKFANRKRSCFSLTPEETSVKVSAALRAAWSSGRMKGTTGMCFPNRKRRAPNV